ncbi:MAG: hypothetical protein PHU31_05955 [Anaerotignum sp.]|nr:hypothetical protein [Anaerotignum sp.]
MELKRKYSDRKSLSAIYILPHFGKVVHSMIGSMILYKKLLQ